MNYISKFTIIPWDNDHSCICIFQIFCSSFIDFQSFFDVLENTVSFFNVFDIVAFFIGDFKKKFAINCEKRNAVGVRLEYGIKLCFEMIFCSGDECSEIFKSSDIWISIEDESPKVDVVIGASLYLFFKLDKFVGVFKIFIDLNCLVDLFFIHFDHFFLNSLQIVGFIKPVQKIRTFFSPHFSYRIDCLQWISYSIVIEQTKEKINFLLVRKLLTTIQQDESD